MPLRAVSGMVDPERFLAALIVDAKRAGAKDFQPLGGALVIEGEQLGTFLEVPAELCVAVFARTGSSVGDVDLFAFDDAGELLAADEAPTSDAAVMVCPPHPRRLHILGRVQKGTGLLALGAMAFPFENAVAVGRVLSVRGSQGHVAAKYVAAGPLEAHLRERRTALGSHWEEVRRAVIALDPHAVSALSVKLQAGRCLDAFVSASDEVASLSLEILDQDGRVVAHGRETSAEQGLVVCSRSAEALTLEVRPRVAFGTATVVFATTPIGGMAELSTHVEVVGTGPLLALPLAVARHHVRMQKLAFEEFTTVGDGTARVGVVEQRRLALPKGCSRIDVIGGAPAGRFRAELWAAQGQLVDRSEGGATAALFSCTPEPFQVRLEVTGLEEVGPFAVELRHGASAPILQAHPAAAIRLLQRLEAGIGPIDFRVLEGVEARALSPDSRHERHVSLAPGCTEWLVATAPVSPLVVDMVGLGVEPLGLARGLGLAVFHACAEKAIDAELRVAVQKPSTVLLLRR